MENVPSLKDLRKRALLWWPKEIKAKVAATSPAVVLQETYPIFKEILTSAKDLRSLEAGCKEKHESGQLPMNVFLKHCLAFSDIGWEAFQKIFKGEYRDIFGEGLVIGRKYSCGTEPQILKIPIIKKGKLLIEGKTLAAGFERDLTPEEKHQIMSAIYVIVFGEPTGKVQLARCDLHKYFTEPSLFTMDSETKYIEVSRQTAGTASAAAGGMLEEMVFVPIIRHLEENYPNLEWEKSTKHRIPGQDAPLTSDQWFYNSDNGRAVAVEVSFQETTNSVIERKRKDAQNRSNIFPSKFKSAFVLDGVGTFDFRPNAAEEILNHADIVVTAKEDEIIRLAEYIAKWLR